MIWMYRAALAAWLMVVVVIGTATAGSVEDARAAYERGDYAARYKSRNELREEDADRDAEQEGYDIVSPVECSREHEVITRMFLSLARGICSKYFPGKPLHHQSELANLLLYVIIVTRQHLSDRMS